jgi:hypothetical protein
MTVNARKLLLVLRAACSPIIASARQSCAATNGKALELRKPLAIAIMLNDAKKPHRRAPRNPELFAKLLIGEWRGMLPRSIGEKPPSFAGPRVLIYLDLASRPPVQHG